VKSFVKSKEGLENSFMISVTKALWYLRLLAEPIIVSRSKLDLENFFNSSTCLGLKIKHVKLKEWTLVHLVLFFKITVKQVP